MKFGRLTVIKKGKNKRLSGRRDVFWVCECECGNIIEVQRDNLKFGNTKSCGCLNLDRLTTHGMSKTKEYNAWLNIVVNFKDDVCDEWSDFLNFYKDMGECGDSNYVLFRHDESLKFSKLNCYWKLKGYINIKRKGFGASNYKGVSYDKNRDKWMARLKHNGKIYNLGRYEIEKDAAIAYNKKAIEIYGEFANLNIIKEN